MNKALLPGNVSSLRLGEECARVCAINAHARSPKRLRASFHGVLRRYATSRKRTQSIAQVLVGSRLRKHCLALIFHQVIDLYR
ncbi:Coenzyme F420-reducing hydrogenase [Pseudomonas syringae pv. actinidiae]|uniref:Coenzyme F420-reducing hydrogenase n=1 Tax=Pseudomonas syringae pv. actinidiae TaxID=103796 RepID=A0AAN4Q5U2_PSESF|nr:Coenzyme F420-reducing hydrogenase [Pseudomonas syringae pv. actinidiae]